LQEIIKELDTELDSRYIIPRFSEKRVRCGKECIKGGKCQMCQVILDLSERLKKANLIVMQDKNSKEEEEDG